MMLREIDRKFYGEDTAAIPAGAGIRKKFGKNDGGRGPKSDISSESYLQTVIRRFKRHHLAAVSLIVLAVIVGAAILAPVIAPYDPNDIAGPFAEGPSKAFWLGTDQIGRDVFSRLLYATRISLLVGVMATLISTGIGVLLGLVAGYFGGVADMIIMRFTELKVFFLNFPEPPYSLSSVFSISLYFAFSVDTEYFIKSTPEKFITAMIFSPFFPVRAKAKRLLNLSSTTSHSNPFQSKSTEYRLSCFK